MIKTIIIVIILLTYFVSPCIATAKSAYEVEQLLKASIKAQTKQDRLWYRQLNKYPKNPYHIIHRLRNDKKELKRKIRSLERTIKKVLIKKME